MKYLIFTSNNNGRIGIDLGSNNGSMENKSGTKEKYNNKTHNWNLPW